MDQIEPVQSGTNPIEFVIKPLSDYIDINKTELRLVVKITKRNGGATGGGKKHFDQQCASFTHQTVYRQAE